MAGAEAGMGGRLPKLAETFPQVLADGKGNLNLGVASNLTIEQGFQNIGDTGEMVGADIGCGATQGMYAALFVAGGGSGRPLLLPVGEMFDKKRNRLPPQFRPAEHALDRTGNLESGQGLGRRRGWRAGGGGRHHDRSGQLTEKMA